MQTLNKETFLNFKERYWRSFFLIFFLNIIAINPLEGITLHLLNYIYL